MAATVTAVDATILGGVIGPVGLTVFAVLLPAALAGVLPRLLRVGLLLALPLAISVLVVNLFFYPSGSTVLFRIGPITATAEGLAFAIETLVRLMAITGALALFYLTTPIGSLVVDLERRGVSPRIAFVVSSTVRTVPAIVERAGQIAEAQRARGLDTEGSPWRRVRGLLPLAGSGRPGLDWRGRGAGDGPRGPRLLAARPPLAAVGAGRPWLGADRAVGDGPHHSDPGGGRLRRLAGLSGMLELEAVTYRYAGARSPSLVEVSLSLGPGEVVGLLGPNEAGKSTTCLVAAGLAPRAVGGDADRAARRWTAGPWPRCRPASWPSWWASVSRQPT